MNCIKDGKYTGDSCFGCTIKVNDCEIRDKVYLKRWIPVSERQPEEKINPITDDYAEYNVTFCCNGKYDTRHYKFGGGHWWNSGTCMDEYVIAWMPLPEPHKPE